MDCLTVESRDLDLLQHFVRWLFVYENQTTPVIITVEDRQYSLQCDVVDLERVAKKAQELGLQLAYGGEGRT